MNYLPVVAIPLYFREDFERIARFLTFTLDHRIFFDKENPQLQALDALENTYTKTDSVLFVPTPHDGNIFTRETLAAVLKLTDSAWHIPYSSRIDSITNFQYSSAQGDDFSVLNLVERPEQLNDAELRDIALSEPMIARHLVSADTRVTGINVTVQLPGRDQTQRSRKSPMQAGSLRTA